MSNKKEFVVGFVDRPNKNGRIYPRKLIEAELAKLQETISQRKLVGELVTDREHCPGTSVCPTEASHLVTQLRIDGDKILGTIEPLNTPRGKLLQQLLSKDGIEFGTLGVGSFAADGKTITEYQLHSISAHPSPSIYSSSTITHLSSTNMNVIIKKLNSEAELPVYGSSHAAGADLFALESGVLSQGERRLFKTGLAMVIPPGVYGRIAPRSGLALKDGIDVMAGVIDEDYRGEVGVVLINLGQLPKLIVAGDKIAQIIFERYERVEFTESETLDETTRGAGGYGSTGT